MTNADWGNDVPENDVQIHFKTAGNTDYTVPTGGVTVNVDKIEFIASIPTTLQETFTFDTPGDTEGFTATNGSISGPTGGVLTFTPTATKYAKLNQEAHHVDADAHKQIHITLKNNSAANDQLRFVGPDGARTQEITTSDSGFTTYNFDLSDTGANPLWTGDQTFVIGIGSLLDGKAQDGGTAEFESIMFDNTLSATNFETNSFSLYPNPAKNVLNIRSAGSVEKVEIYDIMGKQVLTAKGFVNDSEINISNLNSGVYLVKILDQNNNSAVKKLILN